MILIDYNGIAVGAAIANTNGDFADENLIRHTILNQLRMYNKMFRQEYGEMVICLEGGSWRKDVFPQYKANRKKSRDDDKRDWGELFRILNMIAEEVEQNLPYKVLRVKGAEADDIIGVLSENTQEFGRHEDVVIVSVDKDFLQLQKYPNIKQYSPMKKNFITEANPRSFLFEHVLKGDASDGVPNVLSGDDFLVEGIRQSPMTKKKIDAWAESIDELDTVMSEEHYRNYIRNKKMIDLSEVPESLKEEIINTYDNKKTAPKMKILNYLIKKRCKLLIEEIEDFH